MARAWPLLLLALSLGELGCADSSCAEGFVQFEARCFDPDATCDVECGEHELCDITTTPNVCNCAAGFEGDPCTWVGTVQDRSFEMDSDNADLGAWREEGGIVNPDARDNPDGSLGVGEFRPAAICSAARTSAARVRHPVSAARAASFSSR